MRGVAKGLWQYWNSFDIPAYPETAVPDDASLPYITYDIVSPNWSGEAFFSARVWYEDTSFDAITKKVDEISEDIGEGKRIVIDGGFMFLFKEDNFAQIEQMDEDGVKCAYLQMTLHALA